MKKALFILIGTLILWSIQNYGFTGTSAFAEEDGRIIRVERSHGDDDSPEGISILPPELTVEKNIIVIWLNLISEKEINIQFDNPEAMLSATKDHMGFTLNDTGQFAAKYMPHIATASLRFIAPGTYTYTVTSQNSEKSAKGKIIVR